MKRFWYIVYNVVAVPVQFVVFHLLSLFSPKIKKGIDGRRNIPEDLKQFNDTRDPSRVLYLVHCASLGEYEMARPLLEGLRAKRPNLYIALTFFSPSGYDQVADSAPADLVTYLPFDSITPVKEFFRALRPQKLILTSYEVWPNLIWCAADSGIEIYLTSARLQSKSMKVYPLIRSFYRHVYSEIDHIYPITREDERNLYQYLRLSGANEIDTLGNTRYDRVLERARNHRTVSTLPGNHTHPVFIAGSIWPADNRILLPALSEVLRSHSGLQVILAPHEPSEQHLAELIHWCQQQHLPYQRLSETNAHIPEHSILLIDTIGKLAELYHQADLAYVGGGFTGSVHNVMEPAVAKCAVMFGPDYHNSNEAEQLLSSGGGFAVKNPQMVAKILNDLLLNTTRLQQCQEHAFRVIERNAGATEKTLQHILNGSIQAV